MKYALFFSLFFSITLCAQQPLSGPMVGSTEMTEVKIWILAASSEIQELHYWPIDSSNVRFSVKATPNPAFSNSTLFTLTDLKPGTTYAYAINPRGQWPIKTKLTFTTQSLWQYRTDPPEFKVALGSCAFINEPEVDRPGKSYGGDYLIFQSMANDRPNVTIWGGDNIYLREVDWFSRSGINHRYVHTRMLPELQNLLETGSHYAIWDDHDFGPNDATGAFIHKDWTLDAFKNFWANPSYGIPGTDAEDGITTAFTWADIDFFLLDNRYHRIAPGVKDQPCTFLGEAQFNWLIQSLKLSRAPFKMVIVGGQFLNSVDQFENHATCNDERTQLIKAIEDNGIKGVFFVTGDRHCTELSYLAFGDGNGIYDLTVSPLTSTAYDTSNEKNIFRVDSTLVAQRNYAMLNFTGPRKQRVMEIQVKDIHGTIIWSKKIPQFVE